MTDINILVAIDAQGIVEDQDLSKEGTKDSPVQLSEAKADKYIRMIATSKDAIVGSNGGCELDVKVHTGDDVRWRETSLSRSEEYSVCIYKFTGSAFKDHNIGTPEAGVYSVAKPVPGDGDKGDQDPQWEPQWPSTTDWSWKAEAKSMPKDPPVVSYQLWFTIYDRDHAPHGHFYWDPYFTISE